MFIVFLDDDPLVGVSAFSTTEVTATAGVLLVVLAAALAAFAEILVFKVTGDFSSETFSAGGSFFVAETSVTSFSATRLMALLGLAAPSPESTDLAVFEGVFVARGDFSAVFGTDDLVAEIALGCLASTGDLAFGLATAFLAGADLAAVFAIGAALSFTVEAIFDLTPDFSLTLSVAFTVFATITALTSYVEQQRRVL